MNVILRVFYHYVTHTGESGFAASTVNDLTALRTITEVINVENAIMGQSPDYAKVTVSHWQPLMWDIPTVEGSSPDANEGEKQVEGHSGLH